MLMAMIVAVTNSDYKPSQLQIQSDGQASLLVLLLMRLLFHGIKNLKQIQNLKLC